MKHNKIQQGFTLTPKFGVTLRSKGEFTPLKFFKNFLGVKQNNQKTLTGFTLTEIMVVVFIISLLAGLSLASYWRGQKIHSVSSVAQKLAADLRRTQNMALAGRTQQGGAVVPRGYGLYTQSLTQYLIFYNMPANNQYSGGSTVVETIVLENVSLSPSGVSIFFDPPDPTTYFSGSSPQVFTLASGNFSKTVTVYAGGRIDID